jgi:dolichyl-phosphate-mannose-protein mannosyltransferase
MSYIDFTFDRFDELHFGSYTNLYIHGKFFFDLQPPLLKILYWTIAKMIGYHGTFEFTRIGQDYLADFGMQFLSFRAVSALLGASIIPVAFIWLIELKLTLSMTVLSCLFFTLDNGLLVSAKFMTPSYALAFWTCFALWKSRNSSMSSSVWDIAVGVLTGLSIATKYCAFYTTYFFVVLTGIYDAWVIYKQSAYISLSSLALRRKLFCILVLPVLIYVFVFYCHFEILKYSGIGDQYFSVDFQASLEGSRYHPIRKGTL